MLLEDYNELETFEVISEGEDENKKYVLKGIFSRCDKPNRNKRVYPRAIMEEAVAEIQESINAGGFVGEIDHPSSPRVNLERISHKVTALQIMENGDIVGVLEAAGPMKHILESLIDDKIKIGVSTRSTGGVKPYQGPLGEGLVEVRQGLKIKAIDVVFTPSESKATPQLVTEGFEDEEGSNTLHSVFTDVLR